MPETRYTEVYEQGTGKLLRKEPYEVSDEQLAEENEAKEIEQIMNSLSDSDPLKKVIKRLMKKGLL